MFRGMISHDEDFRIMALIARQVFPSHRKTFPSSFVSREIIRLRCFLINCSQASPKPCRDPRARRSSRNALERGGLSREGYFSSHHRRILILQQTFTFMRMTRRILGLRSPHPHRQENVSENAKVIFRYADRESFVYYKIRTLKAAKQYRSKTQQTAMCEDTCCAYTACYMVKERPVKLTDIRILLYDVSRHGRPRF